jgi:uncharacterized membrane protein
MNIDIWMTIIGLGGASFAIRLSGYLLAAQIPQDGMWARTLQALPGCLIASLVSLMMLNGTMLEWISAVMVLALAAITRKPTFAMFAGMVIIAALRFAIA